MNFNFGIFAFGIIIIFSFPAINSISAGVNADWCVRGKAINKLDKKEKKKKKKMKLQKSRMHIHTVF